MPGGEEPLIKRKIVRRTIVLLWPHYSDPGNRFFCRAREGSELIVQELNKEGLSQTFDVIDIPLVPIYLEHGRKPTKAMVKSHWAELVKHIRGLNPEFIIPIGSHAFQHVTGRDKITEWAGRKLDSVDALGGVPTVPIFHPDHIISYPVRMREFTAQLAALRRICLGQDEQKLKDVEWTLVKSPKEARRVLESLRDGGPIAAFDYECTGLDPFALDARIRCVSLCSEEGRAFCIPLEENPEYIHDFRLWLGNSTQPKVAHNSKFEHRWSTVHLGVAPRNLRHDTLLMHTYLAEETSHKLELLAYQHTTIGGYDTPLKEALAKGFTYADVPMDVLSWYGCGDVDVTLRLVDVFTDMINNHPHPNSIWWHYHNVSIPTASQLGDLENTGMHVRPEDASRIYEEVKSEVETIQTEIEKDKAVRRVKARLVINGPFNVNSGPQMKALLFQELKLPVLEKTKTGPSTKASVLEALEPLHPIAAKIGRMRSLLSDMNELDDYRSRVRSDGCISSNFRQDVVVTGRLSSSDPNLQNMTRTGRVKETFTSRWGKRGVIMSADFKQLEVRILGSLAEEPLYFKAFNENLDVHLVTSAAVFNKRMEDVTEEERNRGKRIVFGVIYGIGPKKLAADFGQPGNLRLANQMLDAYFSTHRKVERWLAEVRAFVTEHAWVMNKLGRFRHLPAAHSQVQMERWRAQRQAANHVIQSLGSDLTLLAMGIINDRLEELGYDAVIIGQVHDAILLDCPLDEVEEVGQIVHEVMTNWTARTFPFLLIPLKADVTFGPNYKQQKDKVAWAG